MEARGRKSNDFLNPHGHIEKIRQKPEQKLSLSFPQAVIGCEQGHCLGLQAIIPVLPPCGQS